MVTLEYIVIHMKNYYRLMSWLFLNLISSKKLYLVNLVEDKVSTNNSVSSNTEMNLMFFHYLNWSSKL